ncbi:di-heme oxidoredictase family protein [Flavobacterium sp. GP15]|uniref:di-heme oxidoreductase family protein n=1 Tax=Flavobacterium sp. GP15 TaxID=2758567 RepID=UPI00165E9D6F|nr:di-heme oxidoredictase family protein [Flavobacterium sp. GP15]
MKKILKIFLTISLLTLVGCSDTDEVYVDLQADEKEQFSGGDFTVFNSSEEAFGFAGTNLTNIEQIDFGVGNSFFRQSWVSAPASTTARDGLGPFFNSVSCANCHFKDGRGKPPAFDGEKSRGLLLRLTTEGNYPDGSDYVDPIYGGQLQDSAILGHSIKGSYTVSYQTIIEKFDDGTTVELQKPSYQIRDLGYGSLGTSTKISPRIAPQMTGLGLLEAIDENTILSFAIDNNKNEISGRPNYVYDILTKSTKIGRFGWKSNQPNVRQQVAAAFSGDMGITSYLFPNENCPPGVNCDEIPNGGAPEITDINLDRVAVYSSTLAVPARRNHNDQNVLAGKKTFETLQCISCHIPKMKTGNTHPIVSLRNQTIRPYTDLLLHDMGPGLADNAKDFKASGNEWRTQPLWGIGLIQTVNKHTNLLHDGRARNIEEAILWHGGEAQKSKDGYKKLSAQNRKDLLAFINSL